MRLLIFRAQTVKTKKDVRCGASDVYAKVKLPAFEHTIKQKSF